MTTADDVLNVARYYLNRPTVEVPNGSNSVPGITDWYGFSGSWCAMYCSRVFWDAGMPLPISSPKGFAWVSAGFDWFRARGRCQSPRYARPGDLVAFEWGTTPGGYDHIGIVESVRSDGLVTIEGNVGNAVRRQFRAWSAGPAEVAHPFYATAPDPPAPPPPKKGKLMVSLVRDTDGRLVEFRVFPNGVVLHRWQNQPGSVWSEWKQLTGTTLPGAFDSVAAATNADGRLEVLAYHSAYGVVYRAWQSKDGGAWNGWVRAD